MNILIMVFTHINVIFRHFYKADNFCEFLFSSLDDIAFLNGIGSTFKGKKIAARGTNSML